jgi:hypothetical protein
MKIRERVSKVNAVSLQRWSLPSEAKAELGTASGKQYPWWKEIAGIFADDPAFEEAMRLGRQLSKNLSDFGKIPGLKVADWTLPGA